MALKRTLKPVVETDTSSKFLELPVVAEDTFWSWFLWRCDSLWIHVEHVLGSTLVFRLRPHVENVTLRIILTTTHRFGLILGEKRTLLYDEPWLLMTEKLRQNHPLGLRLRVPPGGGSPWSQGNSTNSLLSRNPSSRNTAAGGFGELHDAVQLHRKIRASLKNGTV